MQTTLTIAPAIWQRYPRLCQFEALEPRQRNLYVGRASVRVPHCPRYTVVDCGQQGAAYYAPQRPTPTPLYTPLQAALLDGVRHMRRWSYYADTLPTLAAPNLPLDGCRCRVCLTR